MNAQTLSRRQWLQAASSAAILSMSSLQAKTFSHPLGAELYTVRNIINKDPDGVIKTIADIGYTEVELGRADLMKFAPQLEKYKLKAPSVHVEPAYITGNWGPKPPEHPEWKTAIAECKQHGVEYIVMPYVFPNERGDLNAMRALVDKMAHAAEEVHAAGLKFAYHNHAFEFKGEKGQRTIDVMLDGFQKANILLEMDVFWVSVAGNDPVAMLRELKSRVALIHLKDKMAGTPVMYAENVKKEAFQEVGNGSLNFTEILKAAEAAGVKHYFVEQDQTPGDPLASLRTSYENLRKLNA